MSKQSMDEVELATPRPWDCVGGLITRANDLAAVAATLAIPESAWIRKRPEAEANAQLIVRAVNAHDALVEAARDALTEFRRMRDESPDTWDHIRRISTLTAWDKLRAALALAQEAK